MLKKLHEYDLLGNVKAEYLITDKNITRSFPDKLSLSKFDSKLGSNVNKIIKLFFAYSKNENIFDMYGSELFKQHELSKDAYLKIIPEMRKNVIDSIFIYEIKQIFKRKEDKLCEKELV